MDSNFTSYPEQAEQLCERIARARLDIQWDCFSRADDLARRPGLAARMREAGCAAVYLGVESGDDGVLRAMAKGYDSATALEGLKLAKDAGLVVHANFLIGFPGETPETVDRTLELIRRTEPDMVSFSNFLLTRGSSAWKARGPLGLEGEGLRWRHATMDGEEARTQVERAMRAVIHGMPRVLIGNELVLTQLIGQGLSIRETLAYLAAVKEWHACGGRCGSPAMEVFARVGGRLRQARRCWGIPPENKAAQSRVGQQRRRFE